MTRSLASLSSSLTSRRSSSARFYSPTASMALVTPLLAVLLTGFLYPVARLIALSFSGEHSATIGVFYPIASSRRSLQHTIEVRPLS